MGFQLIFSLVILRDIEEGKEVNQRGKILIGDQWESYYEVVNLVICRDTGITLTQDEIVYSSPITDTLKKN